MQGFKIKPLSWIKNGDVATQGWESHHADCVCGHYGGYTVFWRGEGRWCLDRRGVALNGELRVLQEFSTIHEAKAAAQESLNKTLAPHLEPSH